MVSAKEQDGGRVRPPSPSRVTVASLLEKSYAQYAQRPALSAIDGTWSYVELGERVHSLVDALAARGGAPGDRMILLGANSPAYIEASHAAFVGGFVRVALNNKLHVREVVEIVNDCGPRILAIGPEWVQAIAEVGDRMPSVEQVFVLGNGQDGMVGVDELIASGSPVLSAPLPTAEDLCALLYTSGTTGRPKGVMLSHGNWAAMIRNSMIELPPAKAEEIVLHVAPLSHFSGYMEPTYTVRGALHLTEGSFDPERVLSLIEARKVTAMPLVPTMINMMLPAAEVQGVDLSSVESVVYGGSAIAPDRLSRAVELFGEVFIQFFGLSEAPMPLSALSARDHLAGDDASTPGRLASAGRVNPFVELRVCDQERRPVSPGEVGEICVRGDNLMAGYWARPEETAKMIDADGWAATGDLGRLDEDGYLYIVDRKRDMIVTGGYNVYPSEVEHAISALRGVREVAVVGAPDDRWGETIVAVVAPEPAAQLDPDEIVGACVERLASYKKPRRVEFVDELPKTGSGKIMRRAIRDRYWSVDDRLIG